MRKPGINPGFSNEKSDPFDWIALVVLGVIRRITC